MGHVALIEFARKQCEHLVILSYTSRNFPGCEARNRERWLKESFPYPSVTIRVLDNMSAPDDFAPEEQHRRFCANYLLNHLETTVDAVFTSEDYGDGFAKYLTDYFSTAFFLTNMKPVKHVLFDKERIKHPTSGTELREAIAEGKVSKLLPYRVRADFVPRILLLGGESTGKTTLAKALAEELNCPWVAEFGRQLYDEREGNLRFEDMSYIAKIQIEQEQVLSSGADMIVCDTSPLTTLFYSNVMFKTASHTLREMANRRYDRVYLCMPDIDFEQDGTRRDSDFRMFGHYWYTSQLANRNIDYKAVSGSVEERVKFIMDDINTKL
jgi:NadR type nicotinamide-nucleotide adenylyltransferase